MNLEMNLNIKQIFGDWIHDINTYSQRFNTGVPFEHVVIDHFFNSIFAEELYSAFPNPSDSDWFHYHNPIEKKQALNRFEKYPIYQKLFDYLQSEEAQSYIRQITGYQDLVNDPHLHGAGLHYHSAGYALGLLHSSDFWERTACQSHRLYE